MTLNIVGSYDSNLVYCAGSFTKLVTTYVVLSVLTETYSLEVIIDDENFLDTICVNEVSRNFLSLFQKHIGGKCSIRDLCSYYSGLPYTFDLSPEQLQQVEAGQPFKHHSILDEKTFLTRCEKFITPVYHNRCKFHYSEISIIFLGYLIEKVTTVSMETLYQKYVIEKFRLTSSTFSRMRLPVARCEDFSDRYDYPSIAMVDHGYFCYSNGYYTTLKDAKTLIENLLLDPVFQRMSDIRQARAASPRLLNGLAVEIRRVGDDIIYGYEGLSFSGCNIWAYSTKLKTGYLTLTDDEDAAYPAIYNRFHYSTFDSVPENSQAIYTNFIRQYNFCDQQRPIPEHYQGQYKRVNINTKVLEQEFTVGSHFIVIRNPEEVRYDIVYRNNHYCILCKDGVHGGRVGFYQSTAGHRYMLYDGTLYKKLPSTQG